MNLNSLNIYKPLFTTDKRYILLYGGRAGGRSYAASQKVILDTYANDYSRIAAMRYILGDVRDSVWSEVKDRIEELELPEVTSDQAMRYELNGNQVNGKGFKKSSSQNTAKLKSLASYNMVWIEEAEEITKEDFINLDSSIRTSKAKNTIILSFNMPSKDHWIIKRWFNLVDTNQKGYYKAIPKEDSNTEYVFATYKDNAVNLSDSLKATYESYKDTNPEYYYTMVKGYVSEGLVGRVFTDWEPITDKLYEDLPYTEHYGLDFGFTNDPTALIGVKFHNKNIWVKEYIYQTGLTNQDIAERFKSLGLKGLVIADSAEPKSIEELKREGVYTKASAKGDDSIRAGINLINQYKVHYTETSSNVASEIQNYVYALDKNKNPTNKPVDDHNHLMDALRYVLQEYLKKPEIRLTWV